MRLKQLKNSVSNKIDKVNNSLSDWSREFHINHYNAHCYYSQGKYLIVVTMKLVSHSDTQQVDAIEGSYRQVVKRFNRLLPSL